MFVRWCWIKLFIERKNRKIKIFKEIFITPASGDSGIAIGACYLSHKKKFKNFKFKKHNNFYLGSRYNNNEIINVLKKEKNIKFKNYKENIFKVAAKLLSQKKIIASFQDGS